MEQSEIEYIDQHLPNLIKNIRSSVTLRATLKSHGLITPEEEEILTAKCENRGNLCEVAYLIEILKTRTNSYGTFLRILQRENQTGAVEILNALKYRNEPRSAGYSPVQLESATTDAYGSILPVEYSNGGRPISGCHEYSAGYFSRYAYHTCTRVVDAIQNIHVKINGHASVLQKIFPILTKLKPHDLLDFEYFKTRFDKLQILTDTGLNIDQYIPPLPEFYIPRQIYNRIGMLKQALKCECHIEIGCECPDIFVFQGLDLCKIMELVRPALPCTAASQIEQDKITSKYIWIDNDDEWEDLTELTSSPLHLITLNGSDLTLLRSTKITERVWKNAKDISKDTELCMSEIIFLRSIANDSNTNFLVICDKPGMGKTLLLQSLAHQVRLLGSDKIAFYKLSEDLSHYLHEYWHEDKTVQPLTIQKEKDVLRVCLRFLLESHSLLFFEIFAHLLNRGQKIYIFLDGFDETPTEKKRKLTSYLERLRGECKGIIVCVATRPNVKGLNTDIVSRTFSYYILPFSVKQQVYAITSIWKAKWHQHDDPKIDTLARNIVCKYRKLQQPGDEDILGTPLKCYMLAMIHETTARKTSNPARKIAVQLSDESSISSLIALYVHYVEAGKAKLAHLYNEDKIRDVLDFHTFAAFNGLHPELAARVFAPERMRQIISVPKSDASVLGILVYSSHEFTEERVTFIHRTFAEYFIARYFSQYWMLQGLNFFESKATNFARWVKPMTEFDHRIGKMFFEHIANTGSRSLITKTLVDNRLIEYNEDNKLEKWTRISAKPVNDSLPGRTDVVRATRAAISTHSSLIPKLRENTLLHFQNHTSSLESESDPRHHKHFCNENIMRMVNNMLSGAPIMSMCKINFNGCFRPDIYSLLYLCLENEFFAIFTLIIQIIQDTVPKEEMISHVYGRHLGKEDVRKFNELIVSLLASKGTSDVAQNLFELYDQTMKTDDGRMINPLLSVCKLMLKSPLEVAVENYNLNMFIFFLDKAPTHGLFLKCMEHPNGQWHMTDDQLSIREKMLQILWDTNADSVPNLTNASSVLEKALGARIYLRNPCFRLLKFASNFHGFSWNQILALSKYCLLQKTILNNDIARLEWTQTTKKQPSSGQPSIQVMVDILASCERRNKLSRLKLLRH